MKYEDKIYEEHKYKTCIVYLYLLLAERGICMDRKKVERYGYWCKTVLPQVVGAVALSTL